MDFLQLFNTDLHINLCGTQILMPQHRLDKTDIRSILQHMGGHRMAEQMTVARFVDPGAAFARSFAKAVTGG